MSFDPRWNSVAGAFGINTTSLAITSSTSSRVLNSLHVVTGTSADYDITISGLSPTVGNAISFTVGDGAVATKQYRLDAGGTVKIAGRTRYLTLVQTNSITLRWDGTDWQPSVLCLDTQWVNAGVITIGSTANVPVKGTNSIDRVMWRRVADAMDVRYEYRQTGAGSNGSGDYLFSLPIGLMNTNFLTTTTAAYTANLSAVAIGWGTGDGAGTALLMRPAPYSTSQLRAVTTIITGASPAFCGLSQGSLGNAAIRYNFGCNLPMTDW